ncbi:putative cell division protein FtsK/SpoIIIE [Mycobacterium xenopi 3993]|nr:putative cell division protein FtsK/SpoIIIE [Mycobacterium xenopi 3993]
MASNNKNGNNSQSNDDDWITDLILALFKALGYLLWWAVLFPAVSIPIIASVGIAITHGPRSG